MAASAVRVSMEFWNSETAEFEQRNAYPFLLQSLFLY